MKNCVIVLDNVAFNKNISVKELIENSGHQLLFLPPYTPGFNPIKNMFSKWKLYVKGRNPVNENELILLINESINCVTPNDCGGY